MKRRELNIGNIVQVGFNKVRVVRDEKVSCDACYFRPICFKDYDTLKWKQENFGFCSENIIDVAYDMLCWCIENGYIKKEGE